MAVSTIQVFVKVPPGSVLAFSVKVSDTLAALKPQIAARANISPSTTFSFTRESGYPLPDNSTVQDCCATTGATLCVRFHGQPSTPKLPSISLPSTQLAESTPKLPSLDIRSAVRAAAEEYAEKLSQLEHTARAQIFQQLQAKEEEANARVAALVSSRKKELQDRRDAAQKELEEDWTKRQLKVEEAAARLTQRELELDQRTAEFAKAMSAQETALKTAREKLVAEMAEMTKHAVSERIYLNIGGQHFTTTKSTLTKYRDTYFSAMLSGRYRQDKAADGSSSIFIDRDGSLFGYVLEYLRDGTVTPDRPNEALIAKLKREFAFYQLRMPSIEIDQEKPARPAAASFGSNSASNVWSCSYCNFTTNYARRSRCFKCNNPRIVALAAEDAYDYDDD